MKELLGLLAVIFTLIGHVPYLIDTLRGKTKPHVFTWIVWSTLTIATFFIQWTKGAGAGSWSTITSGVLTVIIALLAFKKGSKDISKSDIFFFTGALIAIIPWIVIKDPTISVILIGFINIAALIPTIRKTIKHPKSETLIGYAIDIPRYTLALLALSTYNIATFLSLVMGLLENTLMTFLILRPEPKPKTKT